MLNRHNRLYHVHNSTTELSPEVESNGQPSVTNESSQAVDYPDGCSISAANQEFHLYSNQPHHMDVEPAVPVVDDSLESEQHFVEDSLESEFITKDAVTDIIGYGNSNSTTFFSHDKMARGNGSTYLVTRAITETPLVVSEMLHPHDVGYHMRCGSFVSNLTKAQREEFARIISETAELAAVTHKDYSQYLLPSLPRTRLFIDNVYIRGKFSLLKNLPQPSVTVVQNHGYMSLIDCVAHLLSFHDGFTINIEDDDIDNAPIPAVTTIKDCVAVRGIRERAKSVCGSKDTIVLYCTEWSDDFDPSVSTKANRQSCWIKTVTIHSCNRRDKTTDKMATTYLIAVGKKGQCHEAVSLLFAKDIEKLRSGTCAMYSKSCREVVNVYMELLVSLQDQPERRAANHLMLGSGKYTARWGYSSNIAEVAQKIPSCSSCMNKLIHNGPLYSDINDHCERCTNWNTCSAHPLLRTVPPNKYPRDMLTHGTYILPFQLSYNTLRHAVTTTHNKLITSTWTNEEAKQYLYVFGLNNEAVSKVLEHATNEKIFSYAEANKDAMTLEYNALRHHKERYPMKYVQWQFPATWIRGTYLQQHIDVPMHLLFLGITKTTMKRIMEWMKQKNSHANFLKMSGGVLESISNLHLDWCVAISLNGAKFGGWVSENFLAVARLTRWYYSMIPHLRSGAQYRDPDLPYTTWSVKELREWLRVRGLPSHGKKMALLESVGHLLSLTEVPPILPPKGGTVQDIMTLTQTMSVALGNVMQRSVTDELITHTMHYIKRFLSSYHAVDKELINETDKPGWLTSYNFLCLLNIPDLMKQYGPIANLWEGGYDGERFSQELKHRLKGGLIDNWHRNLLKNLVAKYAMEHIELPYDPQHGHVESNPKTKSYKRYKSLYYLIQDYTKRAPLSVVALINGQWGSIINNTALTIHYIQFGDYKGTINGMHYWAIHLNSIDDNFQPMPVIQEQAIGHHCILLPKLTSNGLPKRHQEPIYCVIDSTWMDVAPDDAEKPTFQYPTLHN